MAISFIPNQPILFEAPLFAGQSCLNNDTREYAQLVQAGDTMCVQFKNEPLSTVYSCDMTSASDVSTNGSFANDLSGWDEYDFTTGTNLGTPTNWTWTTNGATSNPALSGIGLVQSLPGSPGTMFLISFEFTYNNGGNFKIGLGNSLTNSWNWVNLFNNAETNIDGRRCLIVSSYINTDLAFYCDTSAVTIKNIIVRDITFMQCVVPNGSVNAHWTYVESVNGWQKIDGTAASAFALVLFNSLSNGINYRMSYKVMNMSEDSIAYMEIQDNANATLSKTYANGEYAEYFNYIGPSAQPYVLANPQAQNGVIYDIKFEEMCYDHRIRLDYTFGDPASIWYNSSSPTNAITYYKDRIVWCFDISTLENADIPGGNITDGCYKVNIEDLCLSINNTSYTVINYTTGTHPCSVPVVGSCDGYGFDFFFNADDTITSFTLRQRLRLLQFNPLYPIKSEEYLYSDGRMVRTYAQSSKKRMAWFDYVDEPTHDVIRTQLLCDTLTIDGTEFVFISEDYEPLWGENGKYNLAQSKVELVASNEVSIFNKKCI